MASSLKHPSDIDNSLAPKNGAEPRPEQVNADAVSLDVSVVVHGSRVVDASKGALPQTEPFEEVTATMIVFPQGGVLRMSTPVAVGQMLVLTNTNSNRDAICRVLKVRTYSNQASYVEFQFTHAQPNYWGVQFEHSAPAAPAAQAPPKQAPSQPIVNAAPAQSFHSPAVPAQTAPGLPNSAGPTAARNAAETSFISIGSKEEVELAATSTTSTPKLSVIRKAAPATPSAQAVASVPPVAPKANDALQSTVAAPVAPESSVAETRDLPVVEPAALGAGLATHARTAHEDASPSALNWKMGAAAGAAALVLVLGGFFLTQSHTKGSAAPSSAANVTAPAQPVQTAPVASTTAEVEATARKSVNAVPAAKSVVPTAPAKAAVTTKVQNPPAQERAADAANSRPETPSQPEARRIPDVTSDLFGSLNAHPVAGSAHSSATVSAPLPDAGVTAPSAGPIAGLNAQPAVPLPIVPSGDVRTTVQQKVTEPRLLKSVQPVYPEAARALHTQGDVTVQAAIDPNGNVTNAKAISGPFVLRGAAEQAIRQWKYQPGEIDGKPATSSTQIVVRFQL